MAFQEQVRLWKETVKNLPQGERKPLPPLNPDQRAFARGNFDVQIHLADAKKKELRHSKQFIAWNERVCGKIYYSKAVEVMERAHCSTR